MDDSEVCLNLEYNLQPFWFCIPPPQYLNIIILYMYFFFSFIYLYFHFFGGGVEGGVISLVAVGLPVYLNINYKIR